MIVIIGNNKIKAEGDVGVLFTNGKTVLYNGQDLEKLYLNSDSIAVVSIGKKVQKTCGQYKK